MSDIKKEKLRWRSKLLIFLGNRLYSNKLEEDYNIPCSSEEFYALQADRHFIQPKFHTSEAGKGENMQRAVYIDARRRDAMKHVAYATIPYMVAVFLVFNILSGAVGFIKSTSSHKGEVVAQAESPSTLFSYLGMGYGYAKTYALSPFRSDEQKLARAKEINEQVDRLQAKFNSREDYITATRPLEAEFRALNGGCLIMNDSITKEAQSLKEQYSKGLISQAQFDSMRANIMDRKAKQDKMCN